MSRYIKYPIDEWVGEWGLSHLEAAILADMLVCECTETERATRCFTSRRKIQYAKMKFNKVEGAKNALLGAQKMRLESAKSALPKAQKMRLESAKSALFGKEKEETKEEKKEIPPTPPIKNKKEEKKEEKESFSDRFDDVVIKDDASSVVVENVERLTEELLEEINNNGSIVDSTMRLYGVEKRQLKEYVGWFLDHLRISGIETKTRKDFRCHFSRWLRIQVENQLKQNKNGNNNSNNARISAGYVERKMREAGLL